MEKLKSIDFRSVIFLLLACVTPAVSPNIALPVALIVLSAMKGFDLWMETKKAIDPSPELRAEIQAELQRPNIAYWLWRGSWYCGSFQCSDSRCAFRD